MSRQAIFADLIDRKHAMGPGEWFVVQHSFQHRHAFHVGGAKPLNKYWTAVHVPMYQQWLQDSEGDNGERLTYPIDAALWFNNRRDLLNLARYMERSWRSYLEKQN
jgi:hypothetical protein